MLYKGFAVCGKCGYAITAERKVKKSGLIYHYYHCTFKSRTQKCLQTRFLREEELTRQVQDMVQKVSLPDEWRDAYLKKLESENADVRHSSDLFVQNLKNDISAVSARLSRLTDAYLNEALELGEYLERKNALTAGKRTLEEKLSDFERKGNHWLELMRNWIIEANQAGNLIKQENLSGMKDFLVDIGLYLEFQRASLTFAYTEAGAPPTSALESLSRCPPFEHVAPPAFSSATY